MKLYGAKLAPNARRVTIYLAEKGIEIPRIDFESPYLALKSPAFRAKNPAGKIPVLELDDGTCIAESASIVEYLEELYPTPAMLGETPLQRAHVRTLERIGAELFTRLALYVQHRSPTFWQSRGQVRYPDVVKALELSVHDTLGVLDTRLGNNSFIAGPRPTVADCTLYALLNCCVTRFDYSIPQKLTRLDAWYRRFALRPSAVP
jgi:glutathione S-transferase